MQNTHKERRNENREMQNDDEMMQSDTKTAQWSSFVSDLLTRHGKFLSSSNSSLHMKNTRLQ